MKKLLCLLLALWLCCSAAACVPVSALIIGDPTNDGDINAKDALFVLRAAVKKVTPTAEQITAGDVDASGALDAKDALMILQYAVGKRDSFPARLPEDQPTPPSLPDDYDSLTPEQQYYARRAVDYWVDGSDFTDPVTIEDPDDAAEIVQKLGGTPQTGDVDVYGDYNGKLCYTPLSNEARRKGQLSRYANVPTFSGTLQLNGATLRYTVPKNVTAYDIVPVTYTVSGSGDDAYHVEATAFEDASRYQKPSDSYFDCNLPGEVAVEMTYEGYVNGTNDATGPRLSPEADNDVPGAHYPAYTTTPLQKTGTLQAGADYTWFKFRYTNTGNTILDGEGNSAFRFKPMLYKLDEDGQWQYISVNPNGYYPLLDYVYPGEGGDLWVLFNNAGGSRSQFGFDPGQYRIVIYGCLRNERERLDHYTNQLEGSAATSATFEFTVAETGAATTPNPVVNKQLGRPVRNGWLADFEEFMSSYATVFPQNGRAARSGVLYVQPAPWTNRIVLKFMRGDDGPMQAAHLPVQVESDSISIEFNPYNTNYYVQADGTRTPVVMTQNMPDMRGNIDRGPYGGDHVLNELRNIREAGVNFITTTDAYLGNFSLYDMTYYMLDLARKMDMRLEAAALYPYSIATGRARQFVPTEEIGDRLDLFGRRGTDAANGILARWNLIRYGDFCYFDPISKMLPISLEENFGWMAPTLNVRYGINDVSDAFLREWLKSAYHDSIDEVNAAYNAQYASFQDISVLAESMSDGTVNGEVYYDWTAATLEYDLFRTTQRNANYRVMLQKLGLPQARVALRSENAVFLAPGISQTTRNAHYRQMYYEQRRAALVPEILQAADVIKADSSYCWTPLTDSEVYELTRKAAEAGFNTAKTPSFNHMTDVAINKVVGNLDVQELLQTDSMLHRAPINRNASLFTWCKAIYEAGGVPGTMWMDYACDLYVTSTQYKELQFFHQKIEEMLATPEGSAWAHGADPSESESPAATLAKTAYAYPEAYLDKQLKNVPRYNQILDFCRKNGQ